MRLRSQLHFIGNRRMNEITFHIVGSHNKDAVVEVDDYDKIWDYLLLLHNEANQEAITAWMKKYDVDTSEKKEIDNFLYENGMVDNLTLGTNVRLDNFYSNYFTEEEIVNIRKKCEKERVLIIGLGTVGNAVVSYLHQMGIKKYILIDDDMISNRNLSHQRHYYAQDVGRKKCEVLKERLLDMDSACEVSIYSIRINGVDEIASIAEKEPFNTVFCCFDKHTGTLLEKIYSYLHERKIDMYLSGYSLSSVKAFKITGEVIRDNIEFENTFTDVITDNAGMGMQGDLAAFLMVRLWMQKISPFFEMHKNSLFYDFLTLKSEEDVRRDLKKITESLPLNSGDCKCMIENKILPYALDEYVRYLCDEDNFLAEIEEWCQENRVNIFDEDEAAVQQYQEAIEEIQIQYGTEHIPILEFGQKMLGGESVDENIWLAYKKAQEPIVEIAINNIRIKKKKYIENYQRIWEQKNGLKDALLNLARIIAQKRYQDKMDFLDYKPYFADNYEDSIEKDFELIKKIDEMNAYLDYTGYVEYCLKHNFIHLIKGELNSACVRNARFGTSDIIIARKGNWQDAFDLVHEIGHGYYNSFINKNVESVDEMTSEVFSLMSEYRLMKYILTKGERLNYCDVIRYRLQSILIGLFSLDLYEEGVLKLDNITLENILMTRRSINKSIFGNVELLNDTYSEYNMFMNAEMVAGKRNMYLYPEALLHAIHLENVIEHTPSVEADLVQYLKEELEEVNINRFYSKIHVEKKSYNEMASEVISFWDSIDKCYHE